MNRLTTRWLIILGILLTGVPLAIDAILTNVHPTVSVSPFVSETLALAVIVAALGGSTLVIVATVGALIKLNQLHHSVWFGLILASFVSVLVGVGAVLTPLLVLIYSFAGPTTPAVGAAPSLAPPSPANAFPAQPLVSTLSTPSVSAPPQPNGLALVSALCGLYVLLTVGLTAAVIATAVPSAQKTPGGSAQGLLAIVGPLDVLNVPAAVAAVVTGVIALRRAHSHPSSRDAGSLGLA
jgi:hypothetical protein